LTAANAAPVQEAPNDGKQYARKNNTWAVSSPFNQSLNTTDNPTFHNATLTGNLGMGQGSIHAGDLVISDNVVTNEMDPHGLFLGAPNGSLGPNANAKTALDSLGGAKFANGALAIDTLGNLTAHNLSLTGSFTGTLAAQNASISGAITSNTASFASGKIAFDSLGNASLGNGYAEIDSLGNATFSKVLVSDTSGIVKNYGLGPLSQALIGVNVLGSYDDTLGVTHQATLAKFNGDGQAEFANGYFTITKSGDLHSAGTAYFASGAASIDTLGNVYSNGGKLITDAPSDGKQYARKDHGWVTVSGGGGTISPGDPIVFEDYPSSPYFVNSVGMRLPSDTINGTDLIFARQDPDLDTLWHESARFVNATGELSLSSGVSGNILPGTPTGGFYAAVSAGDGTSTWSSIDNVFAPAGDYVGTGGDTNLNSVLVGSGGTLAGPYAGNGTSFIAQDGSAKFANGAFAIDSLGNASINGGNATTDLYTGTPSATNLYVRHIYDSLGSAGDWAPFTGINQGDDATLNSLYVGSQIQCDQLSAALYVNCLGFTSGTVDGVGNQSVIIDNDILVGNTGTLGYVSNAILFNNGSAQFANGAASISSLGAASFSSLSVGGSAVAAQVSSDWNATTGVARILNKPSSFTPSAHASSHSSGGSDAVSLAGSQITSGTVADARLSSNVPLINAGNSFTAGQTITAAANTSALTASYSVTGANTTPLLNFSGTWNTSGVVTGLKLNITDTASNANSILMDLQTGGASQFNINKTGGITAIAGRLVNSGNNSVLFGSNNSASVAISALSNPAIIIRDVGFLCWNSTTVSTGNSYDLALARDAANTLAQRNGTNAQTTRIYGSYSDASNGRWLSISNTTGGLVTLASTGNGTGASGNLLKLTQPILLPASSVTLATNGDLAFEATSNTVLTIRYRGSDGTTRSATIALV
jgi:hypothetical protein